MKQIIRSENLNNDTIVQAFSTSDWGPLRPKMDWEDTHYEDEVIIRNRDFFCEVGVDYLDTVGMNQSHSDTVLVVDDHNKGDRIVDGPTGLNGDAMVTNKKNVPLIVRVADCVPVFFYDPTNSVIGVAHSGWKGTYAEISKKTVGVMTEQYKTNPADLWVYIGPSISGRNYNVSVEQEDRKEANEYFVKMGGAEVMNNEYYVDLRTVVKSQLMQLGVPHDNIEMSTLCTYEEKNLYSSRGKNKPSNNVGVLMLK